MKSVIEFINDKKVLIGLFIISWIYEFFFQTQRDMSGIYEALGKLAIDFFVWLIIIGFIGLSIVHSIYNAIKPNNTIKIKLVSRMSISLMVGVFVGLLIRLI